jgi:hypothetical protein
MGKRKALSLERKGTTTKKKLCGKTVMYRFSYSKKKKQEGMGQLLNRKARKLSSIPRCYINATLFLLNPALEVFQIHADKIEFAEFFGCCGIAMG